MKDERAGLPSASAVERYAACPGSWLLSRGIEEDATTTEDREMAESGERIHLWLENPENPLIDLSPWPEELELACRCRDEATDIITKTFPPHVIKLDAKVEKERRLWLKDGRTKRFSGRGDLFVISGESALVIDFKTGRGDKPASPKNLQLRSLAVLLWIKYERKLKKIHVAIVQPFAGKPEVCCYEAEDLKRAEKELLDILAAIEKPDAPLVPGPQCRWCPAKLRCPKSVEVLEALGNAKPADDNVQEIARLLGLCEVAEPLIKAIKASAKAKLTAGTAIPGWLLEPNSPTRKLSDTLGIFKALSDANLIDNEMFLKECVKVGVTDLEKGIAKRNKITSKEAKDAVNGHCAAFIKLEPKEPSLAREK